MPFPNKRTRQKFPSLEDLKNADFGEVWKVYRRPGNNNPGPLRSILTVVKMETDDPISSSLSSSSSSYYKKNLTYYLMVISTGTRIDSSRLVNVEAVMREIDEIRKYFGEVFGEGDEVDAVDEN